MKKIITELQTQQPQENVLLRRSTRERRGVIPNDYVFFLQEHKIDIWVVEDDPINFHQAKQSYNSRKWIDAVKDSDVWDPIKLLESVNPIGCKYIFKIKKDSKGNIEK